MTYRYGPGEVPDSPAIVDSGQVTQLPVAEDVDLREGEDEREKPRDADERVRLPPCPGLQEEEQCSDNKQHRLTVRVAPTHCSAFLS